MRRVVITGMGAVTPNGNGIQEFISNSFAGKVGIKAIKKFDSKPTGITVAGEIDDFDPNDVIGKKAAHRMDLYSQYALQSAIEAMEMAEINETNTKPVDMGVIYGSGIGGLTTIQEQIIKMHDKGPRRVSPMFVPMSIANMAAGNISIHFNAQNICTSIVTACATGTNAIGEAFRQVKEGRAKVMIAGGSEASVNEIGIAGFAALTALSQATDPLKASLPFDKARQGFVLGEGGATLVLEDLEHAQKRGANILGEIVGYGATSDAYHITSPDPTGAGAARAMELAIKEAGVSPSEISYINAHGTATHANDEGESKAINQVFGSDSHVRVSSTKGMTGHLLGAAGAIEAVLTVVALQNGQLPLNIGCFNQDPKCSVNLVTAENSDASNARYAISNSFGFGGHNAVLAFKKWE
ncbi:beta-ketoacyl-ACP synthase II [Limosilactobacillus reuteri]|uniref:3-oxoacyl-[acyl-carrier-protein] synthase 2 n=1 Tax=Limosilactobacillus reuteri TaxID=1598 RepID=A0ABD6XEX8_LIMRT|nr:beta-ketoacyl-ACP synthase II [Limosilactobacillus reuteri]MDD1380368.1 beta-ketoacyl-ACP synthase II [Limosilactobacillus reuteri]MQB62163.1 beta-ketoacyl-[acyl-carrier-protein] synthase II [Limosilactobacillus reuteri]MQB71795.1 beta-ketoacyl-[acyl-carrier-protein] synthase II [Limosilactobacillus reuteri]MQB85134.1 beta-ketoacyl-[acyl-carrier-protein] synthase II [Limosilactobacillus reuteri]MQB93940.1 beta-ketoacyl-[acyl-carrier-protein] synthase II [Limosilactobacillus reuteri]